MNLQTSGIFSFEVYPFALYGTRFKNVKVLSDLDPKTAQSLGLDIRARHAQVYGSLPAIVPNDPTKYNYWLLELPSGEREIIGKPWVKEDTVQVVTLGKHFIEIDNSSSADRQKILNALTANGIKVTKIDFESSAP
jgi:hypothetical protein